MRSGKRTTKKTRGGGASSGGARAALGGIADSHRSALVIAAATALTAILAFHGLGNNMFWDDEANTALFARNLIDHGELTGWNGVNLVGFRRGGELDENLVNVYMPPLQYYVAAAGFILFGDSTVGGRVLFVVAGLLTVVALGLLGGRVLGEGRSRYVALFLLAASPAFLLYIRNCRYYSLGVLFSISLLAAFSSSLSSRARTAAAWSVAILSVAGLMTTNYFNAAGVGTILPAFFLLKEYRNRRHMALFAAIAACGIAMAIWVYLSMNPAEAGVVREDATPPVERFFTLLWWNLAGVGVFEFFPVTVLPILALPFLARSLADARPLAVRGIAVACAMLVLLVVTVFFSPQATSRSMVADMRYLVPIIPLGTLVTAVALAILWRLSRPFALAVAALVVLTNIPNLGFLGGDNGFMAPKDVGCTLCDYVGENVEDRKSNTEMVVEFLEEVPAGTVVLMVPTFMAYPAMYYLPDIRYCCQINVDKELTEEARASLPDYVFLEKAEVELALINRKRPSRDVGPLVIGGADMGTYHWRRYIEVDGRDCSRPEIPWHAFSDEEMRAWREQLREDEKRRREILAKYRRKGGGDLPEELKEYIPFVQVSVVDVTR